MARSWWQLLFVVLPWLPACSAAGAATGFDAEAAETGAAAAPPGTAADAREVPGLSGKPAAFGRGAAGEGFAAAKEQAEVAPAPEVPAAPGGERMLVYHGAMTVEVARVEDAAQEFLARVQGWGGYLASQQDRQYTVRLPAAKFDDALAALRAMGRVLAESRQANDITEEYQDLGIRLDNARRARDRLLALLAKADKVEDILKIEEQLRRLTEEIERMEGRRKFLADQVAMATLTATFTAVAPAPGQPGARPSRFPWIRMIGAERVLGRW